MKTTPREGDYVKTAGMTEDQYHAVAKVFLAAGFNVGEYPSCHEFRVLEAFGINKNTKSLFHAAAKSGDEEYKLNGREISLSDLLGDDEPAWSGEGLPPVGVECLYFNKRTAVDCIGKVIAYNGLGACWFEGEGIVSCENPESFRPLKSEREIAIEEMVKHIKINCYEFVGGSDAKIAGNLYDAGYRMVEK